MDTATNPPMPSTVGRFTMGDDTGLASVEARRAIAVSAHVADVMGSMPAPVAIEQFYLGCLSQASYLIVDRATRQAAAVDPRRDIDELIDFATANDLSIRWIIETHFHADFLSGHLELAEATGATIVYSDAAEPEFEARLVADGERCSLGGVSLELWHTPGHTPESMCVLVHPSEDADPVAVVTGDTLFVGDVGRPDLMASLGITADELAHQLFDSLDRLKSLDADVIVAPGHGAGSACGKALSASTVSSIGHELSTNYAFMETDEAAFVALVTAGQPAAPAYFARDAVLNRSRRAIFHADSPVEQLDWSEMQALIDKGAVLIDTRPADVFARGHVRGSINVGLGGRFAEMVGAIAPADAPIVLICEPGYATESVTRLARVGIDSVAGVLAPRSTESGGGTESQTVEQALVQHPEMAAVSSRLTAAEASTVDGVTIIDVRNPAEIDELPIEGTTNIPLASLVAASSGLDLHRPIVALCAGGYRSMIAASYLRSIGAEDVSDVIGGAAAMAALKPS